MVRLKTITCDPAVRAATGVLFRDLEPFGRREMLTSRSSSALDPGSAHICACLREIAFAPRLVVIEDRCRVLGVLASCPLAFTGTNVFSARLKVPALVLTASLAVANVGLAIPSADQLSEGRICRVPFSLR